jgi:hypothetical protein
MQYKAWKTQNIAYVYAQLNHTFSHHLNYVFVEFFKIFDIHITHKTKNPQRMDLTSLLINTVAGAGGGFLGNMLKKNGLGMVGNLLAGGAGGNLLPLATAAMGLFTGDNASMVTSIITALLGGSAGSLLGGLFKKAA